MTSDQFNDRIREAARHQRLRGHYRAVDGHIRHKWRVSAERYVPQNFGDFGINPLTGDPYFSAWVFKHDKPDQRRWRIDVGEGCVNSQPAVIEYLRRNDPRGWQMPEDYPFFKPIAKILGDDYPFVDRPMWEEPRPFVLVTTPDPENEKDLGGFIRTPDQRRPLYFRTEEMWEKDLYQASVWVSISYWHADPALDLVRNTEAPRRLQRWRVFAGRFPTKAEGVRSGTAKELAQLFLVRDREHPENDEMFVRQTTFWNLRARNVEPLFGLAAALELAELATLAVLPLGAGGLALGTSLLAAETALAEVLLDNLNDILASTSTIEFWSV
jgi:hypothetical protein